MSLLLDYNYAEVTSFGGPDLLTDPSMVGKQHALLAKNVEYSAGSVGTRHGFAAIPALPSNHANVFEVYGWTAPFSQFSANYADNAIVTANVEAGVNTFLRAYNLNTTTAGGLMMSNTLSGGVPSGISFVGIGLRLYYAIFDSSQKGMNIGGQFTFYNNSGTIGTRGTPPDLFNGPSSFAPAVTEPASGVVTAGVHRIGYLIEFASGFTTRVSPDASTTFGSPAFAPISVTASGSKNLRLAFTTAWDGGHNALGEITAVSAIMTTTTNLNQYYIVPGSRTAIAAATATAAFNLDISISDADLASQGVDATPYLYWLTQGSGNTTTGAFKVRHICLFGDRMAYLSTQTDSAGSLIDALYISEQNNYQAITADQHLFQLPGQHPIVTMFRMGSVNYVLGHHEIWASTDNNNVPISWAAPSLLDGRHGTQAIHGVEVAPSGNYAWIADQGGLYLFSGGPITSLPVSYYQTPDWNRINWGAAYCVKIKDDASNKRVHVMVPLDGATTPSHIMTWDYTNGITPDAVMYSLDNVSGYALGAMELVRNDLLSQATGNAGKVELWLGSSGTAAILRKMSDADTNPYRDNGAAINSVYRTCPMPGRGVSQGQILMHHGFYTRMKGAGTITPTIYDIDATHNFPCATFTLSLTPDQDMLVLARIRNELAFVEFATNTLDVHWQASYLRWYYSPYLMQR